MGVAEYRRQVHAVRSTRHKAEGNRKVTRDREAKMHAAAMLAVKKDAIDERWKLTEDFKAQLARLEEKEAAIQKTLAPAREKTAKAQSKLKRVTDEEKRLKKETKAFEDMKKEKVNKTKIEREQKESIR